MAIFFRYSKETLVIECTHSVLPAVHEHFKRECASPIAALSYNWKFYRGHRPSRDTAISTGKEQRGDYLQVLILSDQLLPGKNLISLDAFKAVLGLFILRNKAPQLTPALSLAALFNAEQAINDQRQAQTGWTV